MEAHRAVPRAGMLVVLAAAIAVGVSACGPTAMDPVDPSASAQAADPGSTPGSTQNPSQGSTPEPDPAAAPVGPQAPVPSGSMVPAPGAGATPGADGPTEPAPLPTEAAVLGAEVAFDTGVVVEVVSVEAIEVTASTPREVSGPAIVVNVAAHNRSGEPMSVDSAVVTVVTADGAPGVGTTAGEPSPLAGTLDPGSTRSGRYVFMLDAASDPEVTVSINYSAGEPVALFTGTIS